MGEADVLRRRAEGYLVGLVARYGELEGRSAAASVCHQFGISAYKARRLSRTAEGLKALPDILAAVQQGRLPKPRNWPYTAETAAAWAAASDPKPAMSTKSCPGNTTGPPTSTTSSSYAHAATAKPTNTATPSKPVPTPAGTPPNPHPATATPHPTDSTENPPSPPEPPGERGSISRPGP